MDPKKITSSNVPIVLRNITKWKILEWDDEMWLTFLEKDNSSQNFKFRTGKKHCSKEPLWERQCGTVEMPFSAFFKNHFIKTDEDNESWLYFDYKHIGEWFKSNAEMLGISWESFGYPEKTAKDSTIWIGTKGAHTPCHIDTYGCNLIAQISGRKKWYLFPPKESNNLKPTRVPYEESSIYSSINFSCGCSDLTGITDVRMVLLNPGDVLFVPLHWWHYVENESSAISINIWLPTVSDNTSRLEESLVKYFISSVCRSIDKDEMADILNPNEDDVPYLQENYNIEELSWCLKHSSISSDAHIDEKNDTDLLFFEAPLISPQEFHDLLKSNCSNEKEPSKSPNNEKETKYLRMDVIKAFCHPDVISLVREKLLNLSQ